MIGFDLRVSELKGEITRELIAKARDLRKSSCLKYLRNTLEGTQVYSTARLEPWWILSGLIEAIEDNRAQGSLIHGGGYPYLFTSSGAALIASIGSERYSLLRDVLDPEATYLVESWDLS